MQSSRTVARRSCAATRGKLKRSCGGSVSNGESMHASLMMDLRWPWIVTFVLWDRGAGAGRLPIAEPAECALPGKIQAIQPRNDFQPRTYNRVLSENMDYCGIAALGV